jgi:hypothetical protein
MLKNDMYSRAIATFKIMTILFGCYLVFPSAITVCESADKGDLKSYLSSREIDLSTPEKTIAFFVKAFKIGDDNLLNEVLAPNASLPEFNPIQKLECSSPWIIGFDIRKFREVLIKGQYAAGSEPGDIEVYVLLKADEKLTEKNSKCMVALWEKGVYLLRRTDNKWRIVAVVPFWPEEVQKDIEKLSK